MKCGRWPNIGALGDARARTRALCVIVIFAGVLASATPASAKTADPGFDPGGPGPTERAATLEVTPSCRMTTADISRAGPERNRMIVAVSYCAILKRPADAEGLIYWTDQMDEGMTVSGLIGVLVNSPEFQARRTRNFSQTLAALRLGPTRLEQRRQLEQQSTIVEAQEPETETEPEGQTQTSVEPEIASPPSTIGQPQAEIERQAEAQRQAERWAEEQIRILEEKRAARLRVRTPITAAQFEAQVAAVGLATTDPITAALIHGRLPGDRQPVNVAYVHLSATRGVRVSPGGRRQATVGTWAAEIGAHVAINGNWYAPFDGPAVSGGTVYGGEDHFYTSLFGFTAEGDLIFDQHRVTNESVDDRVVEGVSGHPTLIYRGERTTDFGGDPTFTSRQPRTAIGLDSTGDVLILVTVDGRSSSARGMTGDETARLMEQLGAFDAVMLDGGGSSTMWIEGRGIVNKPSGSLRAVGNQLAVFGN